MPFFSRQKNPSLTGMFPDRAFKGKKYEYYDYSLVAVIILLTSFGLVMLYSTSAYMAELQYNNDMYYFKKQAFVSVFSIIMSVVVSLIDYHILQKFFTILYWGAIALMVLVRTPLGVASHGAKRWLKLGPFQFQPAEVSKIAVIVCMSCLIISMGKKVKTMKGSLLLLGLGFFQGAAAMIFTDNLSTAIIICGITAGLVFIAHPNTKWMIVLGGGIIGFAVLAVWFINKYMQNSTNFRVVRILVWLHPENYASNEGYQTLQALYAIGSGGLLGRGLGNSIQKLGSVPEAQNDFIFSIICEELGIVGGVVVLALFTYLLYRLFFIARNAPDLFGSLLVCGIFIHISLQVILNVGVVLALLPNTGVTLPFISYGGTSFMFLMGEMGIALSVARRIRLKEPQVLL